MFFSLKLPKLPYLNLFICFNNILKKISFSCYIKCNTSHFNEKYIYFFKKKDFSVFFFLHFYVLNENKGKSKKYINFSWQLIFFSQNCINYPVSSVSWRINILSKKDHLYFSSEKKNICNFTKKKFFTEKVNFLMIFCLFHCFHQTTNKKH